ncbi:cell wall hydrolase [Novosphingobium sp. FGD1]|uniref:Cell wall hydrolase n=1 Tax=Novosphingobium silvae TaxID=2692619 RepID=A0A7X4GDX1_9SPHN|nr:cell wall hydrolase [Novosphingobium silvae]MYL96620.1 cell wall hydrolase [Novosphingobium silvae]
MRSKVEWASAMALAATVLTALLSAQGSGAAASDLIPILTNPVAETKPAVTFENHPVVQSLPTVERAQPADAVDADGDADTLPELVSQQAMPDQLSSEMRCLAGAIYFEARGETLEGQLAVGRVIVNRANSGRFPSSYCGVVYQPSQFSFVRGRSMPSVRENSDDWREAVAVAQIASEGRWHSPARGALFFHATRVSPKWRLTRLARVDNHVFYR